MITKEKFFSVLNSFRKGYDYVDMLYKHGVDLIATDINIALGEVFDGFVNTNFNEEGTDWINWYLFERSQLSTGEAQAWDENGDVIPMNTDDDLWEFLTKNNCIL